MATQSPHAQATDSGEPSAVPASTARPATLCGWGRYPVARGIEQGGEDLEAVTAEAHLSRGMGRSYGDASLPAREEDRVASSVRADRFLAFDAESGVLSAEAGASLRAVNHTFLPRGWSSPVSPGTELVTLGGMVAADVHGKNHHRRGSFGEHVRGLTLRVGGGRIVTCSPAQEPELFWATVGGMGLTGHILEVELALERIASPWIWQESERLPNLEALLSALGEAADEWPFTVTWADALAQGRDFGRGILIKGRWAAADEAPAEPPRPARGRRVPHRLGSMLLCPASMKLFNLATYWTHLPAKKSGLVPPTDFFYPLDKLREWNRLYGRDGFTQYQCVLPAAAGDRGVRRLLELAQAKGGDVYLCVIKDFGRQGQGTLSFPMPGMTVCLDLPIRRGRTQAVVDALNEFVIEQGGRVYLAKDAFTRAEHYRAMDPRVEAFNRVRRAWDPQGRLKSALSVRLLGDEA